jgi:hypothetical protein
LSSFVLRHASAGSREWAQGLAREVDVIEGDWKALGWALGGLPVLLDRRDVPKGVRLNMTLSLIAACAAAVNAVIDVDEIVHRWPNPRPALWIMLPVWILGTWMWVNRWTQFRAQMSSRP